MRLVRYAVLFIAVLAGAFAAWRALSPAGTTDASSHGAHGAQPATHAHAAGAQPTTHAHAAGPQQAPRIEHTPPPSPAPAGMIWVPGGTFWMGCDDCGMPDARPVHLVRVDGFWMDETPVTNEQFAQFVRDTGYVTVAERPLDPAQFPGVPAAKLVPGSAVFVPPASVRSLDNPMRWWRYVGGANWRRPEGQDSSIKGRDQHPVVHVAWEDAAAYLKWAGKELPTEAQFEFAARGGLDRQHFAWGDELEPKGRAVANIWQGAFPVSNSGHDGYRGTSPVRAFPVNGFKLYDMGGNVWQWCADWYRPDYYATLGSYSENPQGPSDSHDPDEPGMPKRVQRGGSYLCADEYCTRYLVGSRGKGAVDSGSSNVGFRGVRLVSR